MFAVGRFSIGARSGRLGRGLVGRGSLVVVVLAVVVVVELLLEWGAVVVVGCWTREIRGRGSGGGLGRVLNMGWRVGLCHCCWRGEMRMARPLEMALGFGGWGFLLLLGWGLEIILGKPSMKKLKLQNLDLAQIGNLRVAGYPCLQQQKHGLEIRMTAIRDHVLEEPVGVYHIIYSNVREPDL